MGADKYAKRTGIFKILNAFNYTQIAVWFLKPIETMYKLMKVETNQGMTKINNPDNHCYYSGTAKVRLITSLAPATT